MVRGRFSDAYTSGVYTPCRVLLTSIGHTLLGLLETGPRHGYDLKRTFDEKFGQDRPLHYGQVYSTMSRLLKNGLVEVDGVESEGGPERKRYAITLPIMVPLTAVLVTLVAMVLGGDPAAGVVRRGRTAAVGSGGGCSCPSRVWRCSGSPAGSTSTRTSR
ncbi:hypothetical protein SBADM41S_09698 [Streptomyces badius]